VGTAVKSLPNGFRLHKRERLPNPSAPPLQVSQIYAFACSDLTEQTEVSAGGPQVCGRPP